ncbi:hypothetical protein BU26DRAFT_564071 [Trematosphaeria pertusa]|uniref:Uncharacterized protein n=1 Tax=Trematosphaeria pertusa TaxID=390896 RepID=A0A6A6IHZ1_9PLEO|nr:uncharacterized protein BU26DRAFT_564071 [Trematosphaeria pertusa]KAF2250194.1 hypothetical protein BU26DRAFT_564071 [Trematosphaeria pertusa]
MPHSTTHLHAQNPLSHSPSGDSYTGLGCFPLGRHTTSAETSDLVQTLRRLRERRMLQPISPSLFSDIKAQLAPLRAARGFWSRARDAQQAAAVGELLEGLESGARELTIYAFPDSTRLSSTAGQVWGLFERDGHTGRTVLYVSGKQRDVAGTVLHTFLSSRRCVRLQCFLAEYVLADQAGTLTEEWELPERLQWDVDMLGREELKELLERLETETTLEAPILVAKLRGYCEEQVEKRKEPVWWGGGRGGGGSGMVVEEDSRTKSTET